MDRVRVRVRADNTLLGLHDSSLNDTKAEFNNLYQ